MRLFFALALPDDARTALAATIDALRASAPEAPVTWVPAPNLHATLRFLDEVDDARLPGVLEAGRDLGASLAPFRVTVEGVGTFGGRQPRVVWAGIKDDAGKARLTELAAGIERRSRILDFAPADHPFSAHVTLARVKGARGPRKPDKKALAALDRLKDEVAKVTVGPLEVAVERFVLYESRLHGSRHPEYVEAGSFPLTGT